MGDLVFFIPPVLAGLKKQYPDCRITFVTAWGFRDRRGRWGQRHSGGHAIHLLMTNPHIDELVHWHDTHSSPDGRICREDGQSFPTWSAPDWERQKNSGRYTAVNELDFGLSVDDNPVARMFQAVGLPPDTDPAYRLYFTDSDLACARAVIDGAPHPRIVLLEGLAGRSTRAWDPAKVPQLIAAIRSAFNIEPLWFGNEYVPEYQGRQLTLRENIATLTFCDVAIGVLSGPLHFAAAAGVPTITLFADQPLHRAAPAYFLNHTIADPIRRHRTLLAPSGTVRRFLKSPTPDLSLTPAERQTQTYRDWTNPGRQSTKSSLATIAVDEIMLLLQDMLP